MFEFTENERITDPAHIEKIVGRIASWGSGPRWMISAPDMPARPAVAVSAEPDQDRHGVVRDIHQSRPKQVIVAGIGGIARELDITVLAEGVESEAEFTVLRAAAYRCSKVTILPNPP